MSRQQGGKRYDSSSHSIASTSSLPRLTAFNQCPLPATSAEGEKGVYLREELCDENLDGVELGGGGDETSVGFHGGGGGKGFGPLRLQELPETGAHVRGEDDLGVEREGVEEGELEWLGLRIRERADDWQGSSQGLPTLHAFHEDAHDGVLLLGVVAVGVAGDGEQRTSPLLSKAPVPKLRLQEAHLKPNSDIAPSIYFTGRMMCYGWTGVDRV